MKLAYIHTNTVRSSWTLWSGARALRALGHDVLDVAVPIDYCGRVVPRPIGFRPPGFPPLETLQCCDRVIVCAAEYCDPYTREFYGPKWDRLHKWAIMVESTKRPNAPPLWGNYCRSFWPDASDVIFDRDRALPSFVDTEMFCPDHNRSKAIDVGFMGTLYAKREKFLSGVQTPIVCGQVSAFGLQGESHETWTHLYVDALRSMRIHVDLPSNNPMPTSRPFETLAAGTCLVTWAKLPEPLREGYHYVRYTDAIDLDAKLEALLGDPERVATLARRGCNRARFAFKASYGWRKVLDLGQ